MRVLKLGKLDVNAYYLHL